MQALPAAAWAADERRQQRMGAPGDQGGRGGGVDGVGREEHDPDPGGPTAGRRGRRDDDPGRHDERVAGGQQPVPAVHAQEVVALLEVEQHQEVVGVAAGHGHGQGVVRVPPAVHGDRREPRRPRVADRAGRRQIVPSRARFVPCRTSSAGGHARSHHPNFVSRGGSVADVEEREYLPAMGRQALTPLYDPLTRLLGVRDAPGAWSPRPASSPAPPSWRSAAAPATCCCSRRTPFRARR